MSWKIVYTARARQDLKNIYEYIAYELLSPAVASKQADRILKEIRSLEELPLRYRLYDDEPWRGQGMRYFSVDNYLLFYVPNESENTVTVLRIMYGGRDLRGQLNGLEL